MATAVCAVVQRAARDRADGVQRLARSTRSFGFLAVFSAGTRAAIRVFEWFELLKETDRDFIDVPPLPCAAVKAGRHEISAEFPCIVNGKPLVR